MALDLFAGIPVTDYAAALPWYERLFGGRPSFLPNDIEAVWEVAEHRYIYIVQQPERAGSALVLAFVDDLDDRVAEIARRGIEPAARETYDSGVAKVIYRDAEGNEISFGGRLGWPGPSVLALIIPVGAAPCRDESCDRTGANWPPESFMNGLAFTLKGLTLARRQPSIIRHRTNECIELFRGVLAESRYDCHLHIIKQATGIILPYVVTAEPGPHL